MDLGLNGKVAIVTGASRGIGRAIAIELAREGCDLVIAARDAKLLDETAGAIRALGRRAHAHAADLREPSAPARLAAACLEPFGRIDIVVNNAGATKRGDFLALTDEDFQDGFALKFMGAVRLTRAAWPHLVKVSGAVVNIIGQGGRYADIEFAIGGSVNAALYNFTKVMARRGVKDGVRVNAVSPAAVETDRLKVRIREKMQRLNVDEDRARAELGQELGQARIGRPEDIAYMVCYLAGAPAEFIRGAIVDADGGAGRAI
ncbi:MAG: SDR family oxidoreductase [Alphaproteobacteria bacterium]|nr:SDR family oxidoreductase [Alphaproteobacteria bacterium]